MVFEKCWCICCETLGMYICSCVSLCGCIYACLRPVCVYLFVHLCRITTKVEPDCRFRRSSCNLFLLTRPSCSCPAFAIFSLARLPSSLYLSVSSKHCCFTLVITWPLSSTASQELQVLLQGSGSSSGSGSGSGSDTGDMVTVTACAL